MKRLKIIGMILTSVLMFSFFMLFIRNASESSIPFDAGIWKREENSNKRLQMVSSLKLRLNGISKAEVERLLGTPRMDVGGLFGADFVYLLGVQRRLFDDDGVWLCIKFKNDRVSDVQVVKD